MSGGETGDEITAILDQLRGLLGEGTPVTAPLPSVIPAEISQRLAALPDGLGTVIEEMVHARMSQAQISDRLAEVDPSLVPVVDDSGRTVLAGRDEIDATKDRYRTRDDALQPIEHTVPGALASLQNKANAVSEGAGAVRGQMNPAELRRVAVEALAQKYYQAAKAATSAGGQPGGSNPLSALGSMGQQGGGPSNMLSGLSKGPGGLLSNLGGTPGTLLAATKGRNRDIHGELAPGVASEKGLQRLTIKAARAVSAAFPEITEIGGVRADNLKWHPNGQAIDVMIPNPTSPAGKALGDRILAFAMSRQKEFGIDHVIWQQTLHIPGQEPRLMDNRGSPTQNHMDHVHIATSGGGFPSGAELYAL